MLVPTTYGFKNASGKRPITGYCYFFGSETNGGMNEICRALAPVWSFKPPFYRSFRANVAELAKDRRYAVIAGDGHDPYPVSLSWKALADQHGWIPEIFMEHAVTDPEKMALFQTGYGHPDLPFSRLKAAVDSYLRETSFSDWVDPDPARGYRMILKRLRSREGEFRQLSFDITDWRIQRAKRAVDRMKQLTW